MITVNHLLKTHPFLNGFLSASDYAAMDLTASPLDDEEAKLALIACETALVNNPNGVEENKNMAYLLIRTTRPNLSHMTYPGVYHEPPFIALDHLSTALKSLAKQKETQENKQAILQLELEHDLLWFFAIGVKYNLMLNDIGMGYEGFNDYGSHYIIDAPFIKTDHGKMKFFCLLVYLVSKELELIRSSYAAKWERYRTREKDLQLVIYNKLKTKASTLSDNDYLLFTYMKGFFLLFSGHFQEAKELFSQHPYVGYFFTMCRDLFFAFHRNDHDNMRLAYNLRTCLLRSYLINAPTNLFDSARDDDAIITFPLNNEYLTTLSQDEQIALFSALTWRNDECTYPPQKRFEYWDTDIYETIKIDKNSSLDLIILRLVVLLQTIDHHYKVVHANELIALLNTIQLKDNEKQKTGIMDVYTHIRHALLAYKGLPRLLNEYDVSKKTALLPSLLKLAGLPSVNFSAHESYAYLKLFSPQSAPKKMIVDPFDETIAKRYGGLQL